MTLRNYCKFFIVRMAWSFWWLNNTPQRYTHNLIQFQEYVTFHGKRNFADIIKGIEMVFF